MAAWKSSLKFEAVLDKVIQPIADLFQLRRREALGSSALICSTLLMGAE